MSNMKMPFAFGVLTLAVATVAGCRVAGETPCGEGRPLFDGRTLDGWHVEGGSAEFRVEDGMIAGIGAPGTPGNTFLCTDRSYGDFVLTAEFRCEGGNSGVQFRSSMRPNAKLRHGTQVFGYQYEITPYGSSTGRIFDEARRTEWKGGIWLDADTPKERLDASRGTFVKNGWNRMELRCEGPRITTFLNGERVADFEDDCQLSGFIGLQIHAQGKTEKDGRPTVPGRTWWRNINLRELNAGKENGK